MTKNTVSEIERMVVTRIFDAPRELVWKAWTDPKYIMQWWGPKGFTAPVCQMDFRVGGKLLCCMKAPDGQEGWNVVEYHEIVLYEKIVRYANAAGEERVVSIVGTDEIDLNRNHISWVSPLGRALMKSAAGDSAVLQLPGGTEYLTVLEVCYERISVEPFREPPGSEASAKRLPRRR